MFYVVSVSSDVGKKIIHFLFMIVACQKCIGLAAYT